MCRKSIWSNNAARVPTGFNQPHMPRQIRRGDELIELMLDAGEIHLRPPSSFTSLVAFSIAMSGFHASIP